MTTVYSICVELALNLNRNQNLSHIQIGYMYNSPSRKLVRVDETFEDGLASSTFDFANITKGGLVDNKLTSVFKDFGHPDVFRGYVNTNYPLIAADFLVKGNAVFAGLVERQFLSGQVASVRLNQSATFAPCVTCPNHVLVEHLIPRHHRSDSLCGWV